MIHTVVSACAYTRTTITTTAAIEKEKNINP